MLGRIVRTGLLGLGTVLAAKVVIGKWRSPRRNDPPAEPKFVGDGDFTPEQSAMLAVIRQHVAETSSITKEAEFGGEAANA